jgi:hypothetical protein
LLINLQEFAPMNAETRTCANCGISLMIPETAVPGRMDVIPARRVCRLNPPTIEVIDVPTGLLAGSDGKGQVKKMIALTQQPTADNLVCWSWVPEGTLPGDRPLSNKLYPFHRLKPDEKID